MDLDFTKKYKSQIDYILSNNRKQFSNVDVVRLQSFSCDHRLVRSIILLTK